MRKFFVAAASAALALSFTAGAMAAERMAPTFGNTVVVTSSEGTIHYHFEPDGSYTGLVDGNAVGGGSWTVQGDEVCLNAGQGPVCSPLGNNQVGDTWTVTNSAGETVQVTIKAGR
jgi:opacity protein-like surface antigen